MENILQLKERVLQLEAEIITLKMRFEVQMEAHESFNKKMVALINKFLAEHDEDENVTR